MVGCIELQMGVTCVKYLWHFDPVIDELIDC